MSVTPWQIVDRLQAVSNPDEVLETLASDDPFWVGASYAIDPFVGIIVRLPLRRDPTRYGNGVNPKTFEKIVKLIIDGKMTGDQLALSVEALSNYCREDEWLFWYKRILQGEMIIPISLDAFNKFCPDEYRIPPPSLRKPKPINSFDDLPARFFLQPLYPTDYVFWLIDSTHTPIEIRCYDSQIRRVHDVKATETLVEFARSKPMDIALFGYMSKTGFLVDDILTRDQFTKESGAFALYRRLLGVAKLELPAVQQSQLLTPQKTSSFVAELNLILQQGYEGAIVRNLDAHYPFRSQTDLLIKPTIKATVTCTAVLDGVGLKVESTRGNKTIRSTVRLGLTAGVWKDISESPPVGRRLDVLSCGQKDSELLLPVFQNWR